MANSAFIVSHLNRQQLKNVFSKIRINHEKTRFGSPCWEWIGAKDRMNYGTLTMKSSNLINAPQSISPHRLLYAWLVAPLPNFLETGLVIDHLCNNPPCCNPAHLRLTTQRQNLLRSNALSGICARKTHCKNGHPLNGGNLLIRGKARLCRTCFNDYMRKYHQEHPKTIRQKARANECSKAYKASKKNDPAWVANVKERERLRSVRRREARLAQRQTSSSG